MSSVEGSVLKNSHPFFRNLRGSLVSMIIERPPPPIGLIEEAQQVILCILGISFNMPIYT